MFAYEFLKKKLEFPIVFTKTSKKITNLIISHSWRNDFVFFFFFVKHNQKFV